MATDATAAERRMIMTEFITRNYGNKEFEVIIKTDSEEHYKETQDFARKLIDHAKPQTNADRIRAMSDEELADVLRGFATKPMQGSFLKWLQQPAEEGE